MDGRELDPRLDGYEDTSRFELITGVNPGYGHNNEFVDPIGTASSRWMEFAQRINQQGLPYIHATIVYGKHAYKAAWGCPGWGEDVVVISGTRDPAVNIDLADWRLAVTRIAEMMKRSLGQERIILTFSEVALIYLPGEAPERGPHSLWDPGCPE